MIDKIRKTMQCPTLSKELDRVENIIEYMIIGRDKISLSESEKVRLDRYLYIYDELNQKKSRHEVVNRVMIKYDVSKAQAYKDIFNTQFVISSSISIDERFYEMFLLDSIVETIRLAAKKGDLRAKAQSERNLSIVLGYPKHDDNRIRPEMLTQNILIVSNDPATLGLPRIENLKEKILKWSRKNPEAETIKVEANE
jgi:hypothetical protein